MPKLKSGPIKYFIISLMILLGISYTIFSFQIDGRDRGVQIAFDSEVENITNAIQHEMSEYINILFSSQGLFAASNDVSRYEWNRFIAAQRFEERYHGMQAIGYIRIVNSKDIQAYEEGVRKDKSLNPNGHPDFKVYPKDDKEKYYVVDFIEPLDGNEEALGFDLSSNTDRKVALEMARDMNLPISTTPITLVQEKGEQSGFLVYLPVYANNANIGSLEEKKENIIGYISAVFRANDLINSALSKVDISDKIFIKIYDGDELLNDESLNNDEYAYHNSIKINVAERQWTIKVYGGGNYRPISINYHAPYTILCISILISLLIALIIYSQARTKSKAIELANQLTKDLKKFELAVNSTSDHVVITDADGTILYANPAVKKITGFDPTEIIGKKAGSKKLWGGLMSKNFYKKMWRTIKINKKSFIGEIQNKRKDGSLYTTRANISPVISKAGEVEFFVGIERDISKEKEVDRAKTEFVSLASHQLRTPLVGIKWNTELMSGDKSLNEQQKESIEEIHKANERMIELVDSLLNVSRIELGTFQIHPEKMKVQTEIEYILTTLSSKIKSKKIKIIKKADPKIKEITNDPNLVRMILDNLITNAVKYTPPKGQVDINLTEEKIKRKDYIKLEITDNGYGIPKNEQKNIFTKLYRASNISESDTDGTGLGLYIVKSVLDQIGGKVSFESKEGKGTKFTVLIPATIKS